MTDSIQLAINRMTRSSLGVLRSTPVAFLQSMGGSMPAEARLQFRQACYAGRLAGSESASIRHITAGEGELARTLRGSLVGSEDLCPTRIDTIVERTLTPSGMRFPGVVDIPQQVRGEVEREQQRDRAIEFARSFIETEHTYWTDGSAYQDGVAAGAVVTHLVDQDSSDDPLTAPRVSIGRRGAAEDRSRFWIGKKRKRKRNERTYKEKERSFVRFRCEGGLVAETWTLEGGATAFDAELSAVARAIEVSIHGATPGTHVRVFTDSQATMRRILNDSPGPGQRDAVRCILGARRLCQREVTVSIHWVPGHSGVIGNEIADQWARDAATREAGHRTRARATPSGPRGNPADPRISGAFLKAMLRRRAVSSWRKSIIQRSGRRGPFTVPREGTVPRIPSALGGVERSLAIRFFQLASGHAMIAPFLKEKFGWVESSQCWWCSSGVQTREHLFKECRAWKNEIRTLWKEVGDISDADRTNDERESGGSGRRVKRNKGFGFFTREHRVRPGNCRVGKLMSDIRFTSTVLAFLRNTQVGLIKRGVVVRGEEAV